MLYQRISAAQRYRRRYLLNTSRDRDFRSQRSPAHKRSTTGVVTPPSNGCPSTCRGFDRKKMARDTSDTPQQKRDSKRFFCNIPATQRDSARHLRDTCATPARHPRHACDGAATRPQRAATEPRRAATEPRRSRDRAATSRNIAATEPRHSRDGAATQPRRAATACNGAETGIWEVLALRHPCPPQSTAVCSASSKWAGMAQPGSHVICGG